jgi:methylated-DNA-[protein]-cysteine S-methyltransferase
MFVDRESNMVRRNRYQLFETAAGVAAIGWNGAGVTGLRLPAPNAHEAERALLRRLPDAMRTEPPVEVRAVIDAAIRYFSGERVDFSDVPIDMGKQDPFFARVYDRVRNLGWGETTTYGAIAQMLGAGPEYARDVGQAMAQNPIPLIVPCHRVTAAGGKIGGFSAPGGSMSKARMLELEGVAIGAVVPPPAQRGFDF